MTRPANSNKLMGPVRNTGGAAKTATTEISRWIRVRWFLHFSVCPTTRDQGTMVTKSPTVAADQGSPTPQLTLPSRCFTDPGIYAQEIKTIFSKVWQPVGHGGDVVKPGSYITGRVADQDVAVVRGRDGALRGFFNVCQHRGHRLLKGKGDLKVAITCPYHAWAYGLGRPPAQRAERQRTYRDLTRRGSV